MLFRSLLIHYLINKETDEKKKLFLINQELEQIRTTVFRQLMFAEFELYTHETLEKGTPLTAEDYNKVWHDLNVKYFGEDMIPITEIRFIQFTRKMRICIFRHRILKTLSLPYPPMIQEK